MSTPKQEFSKLKALIAQIAHRELTELEDARIDVKVLQIIRKEMKALNPSVTQTQVGAKERKGKNKMKIGDELYKYQGFGKLATYICTGIIKRDKLTQYEVECQNCDHGFNCRVLVVKKRGDDVYSFVVSVNDDTGEYECWHHSNEEHERFFSTKIRARDEVYDNALRQKRASLQKLEDRMVAERKSMKELEQHYNNLIKASAPTNTQ